MRIISFAWTTQAFLEGKKTVTRRMWKQAYIKPGDLMQAYDKSPRAGGKRVGTIKIVAVTREPLHDFLLHGERERALEGGLWKTPGEYMAQFLKGNPGMLATDSVWRIEFKKYFEVHAVTLLQSDVVDESGDTFSKECLEDMAKQKWPLTVSWQFNHSVPPIGALEKVYMEDGNLKAQVKVDPYMVEANDFSPGGKILETHQTSISGRPVKVIDRLRPTDVAAVPKQKEKK